MDENIFINQLRTLVGFKTLSGNIQENKRALDYIETLVSKGVSIKRFINDGAEVLVLSVKDTNEPDVCYMVHVDVVSGSDDQFDLIIDGDKLVGRGTSDMKFSIPIGISLLNDCFKRNINFSLVITTDEETGGLKGAKHLREIVGYSPKLLIVPDGGENLNFVDKAKGVCQIQITAKGKSAHASRPWLGRNALETIVEVAVRLNDKYGSNNKIEAWKTTMNIGTINGGVSTNQVCDLAEMKLDFRYPETDSIENIIDNVENITSSVSDEIEVKVIGSGLPTFTDVSDDRVKKYLTIMSKIFSDINIKPTYGASDARHFSDLKIPVIMHKPLGGEIHSENEWVSLSSSMKFVDGLKEFIASVGG